MSDEKMSARDILASASERVRKTVNSILEIEHEFHSYRNLSASGKDKEISQRIRQLIEREVNR